MDATVIQHSKSDQIVTFGPRRDRHLSVRVTPVGLPDFEIVEPALRAYLDSISSYRKNVFPELAPDVRRRIAGEWEMCFEEWGYAL